MGNMRQGAALCIHAHSRTDMQTDDLHLQDNHNNNQNILQKKIDAYYYAGKELLSQICIRNCLALLGDVLSIAM